MIAILNTATNVSDLLMIAGFLSGAFFLILRQILKKEFFPSLSRQLSADIIKLIIERLFTLALIAIVFGFAGFVLTLYTKPHYGGTNSEPSLPDSQIALLDEEISTRLNNFKTRVINAKKGSDLGQAISTLGIMPNDTQYSRIEFQHHKFTHLLVDLGKSIPDNEKKEVENALLAHRKLLKLRPNLVGERAWDKDISKSREKLLNVYIHDEFNIRNWIAD